MAKSQSDNQRLQPSVVDVLDDDLGEVRPVLRAEKANGTDGSALRNRAGSTNSIAATSPPPINESVTHSLNNTQRDHVSPDLIARITEQVLKEIESRKQPNTHIPAHFYPPHPPPANAPLSPTASIHSQTAQRDVYVPTSPRKTSEYGADSPPGANTSPARAHSPHSPNPTDPQRASANGQIPVHPLTAVYLGPSEEVAATTLEKIWGKLFDDGKPTEKMGQLLRGAAEYMIDSYEPKKSLVVTPDKMQRYYHDTHIPNEPYPWHTIFDDSVSCISRMYRELGCEHHLVQEPDDRFVKPDIPGLTPRGFQQWATMVIQAHPDEAFQRLRRIVRELPIDNPDLRNERFPKELPRRLFPMEPDLRVRETLVGAIEEHARVSIHRPSPNDTPRQQSSANIAPAASSQQQSTAPPQSRPPPIQHQAPPPEIHRPPPDSHHPPEMQRVPSHERLSEVASVSSETSMTSSVERERKPYGGANLPPSCAIENMNPVSHQPPLERTRKPYSAKDGEGRQFEPPHATQPYTPANEENRSQMPSVVPNGPPRQYPQGPPPNQSSVQRANSAASRPVNIPPPPGPPRTRTDHSHPPPAASASYSPNPRGYVHRASISSSRRRGQSPPPGAQFRSSDGDVGGRGMSNSFESSHSWGGRDDGRRHDYRDEVNLPPPSNVRREQTRGASPSGRRSSLYSDEDFYRPRRETVSGRPPGPW